MKLTNKQERFSIEYVKSGNASDAYRLAYSAENMTNETIHVKASELLSSGKVSVRVRELKEDAARIAKEKFEIDSEAILKHLDNLRKVRIDDYVKIVTKTKVIENKEVEYQSLEFVDFQFLSEDKLSRIKSVRYGSNGIELTLHDVSWTIEKINKHIGFYEKDNSQKDKVIIVNG